VRLSPETLAHLPADVRRPACDPAARRAGIVHFGIGAFHRAHQAVYTDDAMNAGERDWGIVGVSLRSASVAGQMNPQDGLYTVAVRAGAGIDYRLIGAVQRVLVAAQDASSVAEFVAAPSTHILTFTITEKGYCRSAHGTLDPALADETSVYRFLADGLALRRARGLGGLTLLSCDNLAENGVQLRRLVSEYLTDRDAALADWVEAHCTFPSSMVDRIVPANTEADLAAAEDALGGLRDLAHVVTEPFSQWVIEDRFAGPRPSWEDHGAELVADVRPYETAKLRMLNGAHSLLAYLGLMRGHEFVHQAIADPNIRPLAESLMREEAASSIAAAPGQGLDTYADALIARFSNSALNHRLIQIAMDGSQKIPQRWLETLAFRQQHGRQCPAILTGLAAWLLHVRGDLRPVDDPMAARLASAWREHGESAIVPAIFGAAGPLACVWLPSRDEVDLITRSMNQLEQGHGAH